jgi:hypothetical protein
MVLGNQLEQILEIVGCWDLNQMPAAIRLHFPENLRGGASY